MASKLALGLGGAIFALALALGLAGWRFNLTPSVRGLIFRPITAQIAVGRYVAFCLPWTSAELPESQRTDVPVCTADHPNRVKLIKRVGFIEPDGRLYVEGSNPRSYDSRFYGPIPRNAVTAVMARVW